MTEIMDNIKSFSHCSLYVYLLRSLWKGGIFLLYIVGLENVTYCLRQRQMIWSEISYSTSIKLNNQRDQLDI